MPSRYFDFLYDVLIVSELTHIRIREATDPHSNFSCDVLMPYFHAVYISLITLVYLSVIPSMWHFCFFSLFFSWLSKWINANGLCITRPVHTRNAGYRKLHELLAKRRRDMNANSLYCVQDCAVYMSKWAQGNRVSFLQSWSVFRCFTESSILVL